MHKVLLPILLCCCSFLVPEIEVTAVIEPVSRANRPDKTLVDLVLLRQASLEAANTAQTLAHHQWSPAKSRQTHKNSQHNKQVRSPLPPPSRFRSDLAHSQLYSPAEDEDPARYAALNGQVDDSGGGRRWKNYDSGTNLHSYGIAKSPHSANANELSYVIPKRQSRNDQGSAKSSSNERSSLERKTRAGRQYDVPQIRKYAIHFLHFLSFMFHCRQE